MDNDTLTLQARTVFDDDRYAVETTGIRLEEVMEHGSICAMDNSRCHLNASGAVMGGAIFTLADFAAAVAANSEQVASHEPLAWVSLDATIHYLSSTVGCCTLRAKSKAIKHGRTTALYQTIVSDVGTGRTVAVLETTMIHT